MRFLRVPSGLLAGLAVWVLFVGLAAAQPAGPVTRQLVPVPFNENAPVTLAVELDQEQPRIGSTVSICFQASRAGFATLWNISTKAEVTRIFPNEFQPLGVATKIAAGKRYCAGVSGDPFRFRVDGPAGTEDLYLLWTARTDLQPTGASYPDAEALVADMKRLGSASKSDWASTKVTYDIVPAEPLQQQPQAQQQPDASANTVPDRPASNQTAEAGTPKIYILAMGANVEKLTKSNQDAEMFTQTVTALFGVPPANVRMIKNAKNADFRAGMQWLQSKAKEDDFVFIYFSGHGGRFKSASSSDGWDEFLVPYDFEDPHPDLKNLIFSQVFATLINQLPTKNVVATIDACHSAGVFRSLEANVLGARGKFYVVPDASDADLVAAARQPATRAAGGRDRVKANGLLLAAAKREENALEGSRGSFFTLALVAEMTSKQGGTLADAFTRSVDDTLRATANRQTPEAVGDLEVAKHVVFGQ